MQNLYPVKQGTILLRPSTFEIVAATQSPYCFYRFLEMPLCYIEQSIAAGDGT